MTCVTNPESPDLDEITSKSEKWPEEGSIFIKRVFDGADDATITDLTLHAKFVSDLEGDGGQQTMQTDVNLGKTVVATAAVMCRRFEGPYFTDPVTGQALSLNGNLQERIATVGRLPKTVLQSVNARVKENNPNPLEETEKPGKSSKSKSPGR